MSAVFKYIYGPVYSWRLGMSLGLDPLSINSKVCNFDCTYCQLGRTRTLTSDRQVFVRTNDLIKEVKALPAGMRMDHLTFSGRGEPTLAANLGDMIRSLREIRPEPIAVITNSSLLGRPDVREDLRLADVVMAKLDACSQQSFARIDQAGALDFQEIIDGIKNFRKMFTGKLALQVMLVEDNIGLAKQLADIARSIHPDEVQLNTPLRRSAAAPLTPRQLVSARAYFTGFNVATAYDSPLGENTPMDEAATALRHGKKFIPQHP